MTAPDTVRWNRSLSTGLRRVLGTQPAGKSCRRPPRTTGRVWRRTPRVFSAAGQGPERGVSGWVGGADSFSWVSRRAGRRQLQGGCFWLLVATGMKVEALAGH
jgi:hypothetical protein